jgi:hypothetical protein
MREQKIMASDITKPHSKIAMFSLIERLPLPVAFTTSILAVLNGFRIWVEGAADLFGKLTAIVGFPIAICMLVYWWRKAKNPYKAKD